MILQNVSPDNLTTVNGVLASMLVVFLSAIGYLYVSKQKQQDNNETQRALMQKDFDDRLERKEDKLDQIIKETNNDFKRFIEDGHKDKAETKYILDKLNDILLEVKSILHKN